MVERKYYRVSVLVATLLTIFSAQSEQPPLPTRPLLESQLHTLPKRHAELSDNEKEDLKSLLKASERSQQAYENDARQTVNANHKKIGQMPVAKTEHDLINDTVTGAISESDIADRRQNKIAGDYFYILVSSSLSDDEIRQILGQYKNRSDVALVIRGVKDKKNILQELSHWQQLVLDSGSSAPVNLDPTIFKNYNVSTVPTIIHEKDGELVARVSGISNVEYLKNKKGELGTAGPTKDISEISLLDIIKERIENLDFEKMKNEALDNFWSKQKFSSFPDVQKRNQKKVTPNVVIPQDIVAPNGQIVAKKGKINPLDVIPFSLKLIFFDARSDWQRNIARREYQNVKPGIQAILITTNVYGDGWQTFKDAATMYGDKARLYMIQPGMAERFSVTSLPSIVTSNGNQYVVDEYPKDEAGK
ncbi:conjugal transfer protein [Cronobacter dublinensis subsp. dublinensis]|nr:conjugal transfer protein [Cronobacter dublinensis subsp. dublinensis]EGT5729750.1 conjugal transfer protein [Cronobacter dublinensis subsp. dublinensis]